jgi:hypothetical protein
VIFLEIRLGEGDGRIRTIEYRRIEIEIWEGIIRIEYILNGALDIKELVIKITLCELIVW